MGIKKINTYFDTVQENNKFYSKKKKKQKVGLHLNYSLYTRTKESDPPSK